MLASLTTYVGNTNTNWNERERERRVAASLTLSLEQDKWWKETHLNKTTQKNNPLKNQEVNKKPGNR